MSATARYDSYRYIVGNTWSGYIYAECRDFRDSETKPGLASRILEELCAKCERTARHEYATRVNAPCINVYVAAFQPAADSSSATTVSPSSETNKSCCQPNGTKRAYFITFQRLDLEWNLVFSLPSPDSFGRSMGWRTRETFFFFCVEICRQYTFDYLQLFRYFF